MDQIYGDTRVNALKVKRVGDRDNSSGVLSQPKQPDPDKDKVPDLDGEEETKGDEVIKYDPIVDKGETQKKSFSSAGPKMKKPKDFFRSIPAAIKLEKFSSTGGSNAPITEKGD